MPNPLTLLPAPRHLVTSADTHALADQRLILLDSTPALPTPLKGVLGTGGLRLRAGASVNPQALRFAAARFQQALRDRFGLTWELVASPAIPQDQVGLVLRIAPERVTHPQGYELDITPDKILIEARDEAGIFYGVCTLIQILDFPASRPSGVRLLCLRVSDWPDFPARGVMLDVSRDKVPSMDTLLTLVDMLAGWKINQLQLYTEHTFAYRNHRVVWEKASPMTGEEILALDAYCRERFIELVPNQSSFAHLERWLTHKEYVHLAEREDSPFSISPAVPGSIE